MVKACRADDITSRNLCRRSLRNVVAEMYKDEANLRNCRNVTWNEHGSGLMFEDFNIPIVKLQNGSDVDFIKKVSSFFVCFFQTLHCILSKLTKEWESFIYKPYKC